MLIAHVVTRVTEHRGIPFPAWRERFGERAEVAIEVLEEARQFAERIGVRAETLLRIGVSPAEEILALARARNVDLLAKAAATMVVVSAPQRGESSSR